MNNFIRALIILACSAFFLNAKADVKIIEPLQSHPTTFAIIVDDRTYSKIEETIINYRNSIENDGLSAYILVSDWKTPDDVKGEILKIYKMEPPLEGIVLVGEIPIPMIRGAQHMTSAFKMDEDRYPWFRSSCASDRFYDDFDLKFDYLKQDSVHTLCHYYWLRGDSPQIIEREIYSGRIYPNVEGDEKYSLIASYLQKAVKAKSVENEIDNMLVYTGHGYHSEALTSWTDEHVSLREQFPQLFAPGGKLKWLNFRMSEQMKEILMSELSRPELDIAIFHAHGGDDVQYLLDFPDAESIGDNIESIKLFLRSKLRSAKDRKQNLDDAKNYYIDKYGIPSDWFDGTFNDSLVKADSILYYEMDLHSEELEKFDPQAELIIFDECFNGSFHEKNYIAGEYIFDNGNTIVGIGNTVNCLQDKWANKLNGLLNYGVRVGQYHKFANYLENHIIGDPTFRFTNNSEFNLLPLLKNPKNNSDAFVELLNSESMPLRGLAAYVLSKTKKNFENKLLDLYQKDPSFIIRLHVLNGLAAGNTETLSSNLKHSINDPFEFIRRMSIKLMGKIGSDAFVPYILNAIITDESERVSFSGKTAVGLMNTDYALQVLDSVFNKLPDFPIYQNARKRIESTLAHDKKWLYEDMLPTIYNDSLSIRKRNSAIRTFRNYNFNAAIPELIKFIKDEKQPEVLRINTTEALGWFVYSYRKKEIIDACSELLASESISEKFNDELLKTKNRLLSGANVPLTP